MQAAQGAVVERYSKLEFGIADASPVVLSVRHHVLDVLTLDRRHFGSIRGHSGKRFKIRPDRRAR